MNNRLIKYMLTAIVVIALLSFSLEAEAQCAMCKASSESNLKNGGAEAQGLNTGILYLLAMPYLLVASIGLLYWRNKKRQKEQFA